MQPRLSVSNGELAGTKSSVAVFYTVSITIYGTTEKLPTTNIVCRGVDSTHRHLLEICNTDSEQFIQ